MTMAAPKKLDAQMLSRLIARPGQSRPIDAPSAAPPAAAANRQSPASTPGAPRPATEMPPAPAGPDQSISQDPGRGEGEPIGPAAAAAAPTSPTTPVEAPHRTQSREPDPVPPPRQARPAATGPAMRKISFFAPAELYLALRLDEAREGTTMQALILGALRRAGYAVEKDLLIDRRSTAARRARLRQARP